jgi:hypothetical protein
MNTSQEHSTSLNSVPCAHFRVSPRDCAIHSFRWVDFADFGLVGFRFFVRWVKKMWAFCQWDYRSFTVCLVVRKAILRDARGDMLFAPYGHHVPSWERIQGYFSPTHLGSWKMCIFYSLDRQSEHFFWVYAKADFVTRTLLCWLPTGTPWLLMSDDASIFCERKKRVHNNTFTAPNCFFLFFTYPHACMRAQQLNHFACQDV